MNKISAPVLASILLFILIVSFSCNTTEPPLPPQKNSGTITISLLETSCTEAWIDLKTDGVDLPAGINLLKDDSVAQAISLGQEDTTIYIARLLPNKIYSIQASTLSSNQSQVTSNKISVQTLTTTSNNFTFQTWTFGDDYAGSSSLNDVTIINENNIWAVGAIYKNDSTGHPDPNAYNLAKWDGTQWTLHRIFYFGQCSAVKYPPLKAIFVFPDNKIAVTNGGSIGWVIGDSVKLDCEVNPLLAGAINKIWGINSNDFYAVGNSGSIAHYKDGVWSKIQSRVTLQFLDIYGTADTQTGNLQILAVCTQNYPSGRAIFSLNNNIATEVSSNIPQDQIGELFSIWFKPNRHYYLVGDGIYEKRLLSEDPWKNNPSDITRNFTTKVRGNGLNDVFVVGVFGEFLHFNGINWRSFKGNAGLSGGDYGGLAVKNNLVVAVGENNPQVIITLGRR